MDKILQGVNAYYTDKIIKYGATPAGVDWNSIDAQYIRFKQLLKVIDFSKKFSLLDYGCGYGQLAKYIIDSEKVENFKYTGYDISQTMIEVAKENFSNLNQANFVNELNDSLFDYVISSGIFNVKLDLANDDEWFDYICKTLEVLNNISIKGFSFNALTKYSDASHMKNYLYYSDPLKLFDYCKNKFSTNVALLHDYGVYEFTIIVRK
jgi:SAM-dependent methyltransferase